MRASLFDPAVPSHLLGHPHALATPLFSNEVGDQLLALVKEMAEFPTNVEDLKFYKTAHEHIGEGRPPNSETGECEYPLIMNVKRTLCTLPGRIDVARHFFKHGGVEGVKEDFDISIARLLSFGRYMFDIAKYPLVQNLFNEPHFQQAAKTICPLDKQFLDPFQYNFIIQLPGQSVPLHIDAPYFWGATRFQFPQWLLAVMVFSDLFKDQFINQVQVVGYIHKWTDFEKRRSQFIFWDEPSGVPKLVDPSPNCGSVVDGSKVVHAAMIYGSQESLPPRINRHKKNMLRYHSNDQWTLNEDDKVLKNYSTDDLRITIVYRARCFADEVEKDKFYNYEDQMSLDYILDTLKNDLEKRGAYKRDSNLTALELSELLMNQYVRYPYPVAGDLIPFNYCTLMTW